MFCWTDDMISFMQDAANFGSYQQELADWICGALPAVRHVCDAGCGLGFLSVRLAERFETVTAADIDQYLKRNGDAVNITTIYRYLDKLATDGTVMKYVAEAGGKAVYQYVELGQHCEEHLHLKCVKCGCIIHLDCGFMDEIAEHIQKDHGFQLQCKNSILYGICKDCRRE